MQKILINIDTELLTKIKKAAKQTERNTSQMIRLILAKSIKYYLKEEQVRNDENDKLNMNELLAKIDEM